MQLRLLVSLIFSVPSVINAQTLISTDAVAVKAAANLENSPLKQSLLLKCSDFPQAIRWNNSSISLKDDVLTLSGMDNTGRSYVLKKDVLSTAGCELWEGDVTGAGKNSLILLAHGNDSSGGYDSTLTIITKDANQSIVPWQANGRFASSTKGITSVLPALSGSGADILIENKEGIAGSGQTASFFKYRFSSSGVKKILGQAGTANWPLTVNPTAASVAHANASILSLGWNLDAPSTKWLGLSTDRASSGAWQLRMQSGSPVSYPEILVVDDPDRRRVVMDGEVVGEIESLSSKPHETRLFGSSCEEEDCRPMLMWVGN